MKPMTHRKTLAFWTSCALALGATATLLAAKGPEPAPGEAAPSRVADSKYIGAKKCKSCHSSEEMGDQYGAWEHAAHSKAWETLAGDEAKKVAAERGIADPQKADECVKCHVTAFGVDESMIKRGFKQDMGVQCESCHGPGEDHMKARFAAAASESADQKAAPGEIVAAPSKEVCIGCHNSESPSYKEFCYHAFSAKIRHLRPERAAKVAALPISDCSSCHSEGSALIEPLPAWCTTCHDPVPAH